MQDNKSRMDVSRKRDEYDLIYKYTDSGFKFVRYSNGLSKSKIIFADELAEINDDCKNEDRMIVYCNECGKYMKFVDGNYICDECGKRVNEFTLYNKLNSENQKFNDELFKDDFDYEDL